MIHFYQTIGGRLTQISGIQPGCWVSVYEPTAEELTRLTKEYGLDLGFVRACVDPEESAHIEREDGQTLLIVDTSVEETAPGSDARQFSTVPLGIITTGECVFTISLRRNRVLAAMADGAVPNLQTDFRTQFVLQILMRIAAAFISDLKQIDRISYGMEGELSGAMTNAEIVQLMGLQKSLVYFTTALKADLATIDRIQRGRVLKLYPEDADLMEDVINELRQAAEMAAIYTGTLTAMMDAFSYVIANNQNAVMWKLTIITVLIEIPNIIFGFYGINTDTLPMSFSWIAPFLLSLVLTGITAALIWKFRKF